VPTESTGAAGTAVHALLTGPRRAGRVIAALAAAVYVELDPVDPRTTTTGRVRPGEDVIALLGRDAVRVPIGVVLPTPLPPGEFRVGAPAQAGEGRLWVPGSQVRVTRWWRSDPLPPSSPMGPLQAAQRHPGESPVTLPPAPLPADVAGAAAALGSALSLGLASGPPAGALLGLGPGLTPAGDDVLAGALVALHHLRDPRRDELAAAVEPLLHRTTTVSAALLRQAALGRAVPQLAAFVAGLCGPAGVQQDVLQRLLAVGSTSGACLAFGASAAAQVPGRAQRPARSVEVW